MSNSRDILDALWPEGSFWTPATDDDYDNLLDGVADNTQYVQDDLAVLSSLRDPMKTTILSDLEKDYGIIYPIDATDTERRQALKGFMFNRNISGAYDQLQDKLIDAGFDVIVIPNSPPIDPNIYYDPEYELQGELVVNFLERNLRYDIPENPNYWPLFFFIGDSVTRDEYGNITNIEPINVPDGRRQALKQLILKYKPLHSWCLLVEVRTQYLSGTYADDGSDFWLSGDAWLNGFGRRVI
jgi:hypothetical protein